MKFVRLISKYKDQGCLTDTVESIRSGRRVLCVHAEFKRKVKGIIHDESTTGKTAFIEPERIVEINNNIIEFEADFKKEVFRLLKELCAFLRPSKSGIEEIQSPDTSLGSDPKPVHAWAELSWGASEA